MNEFFNFYIKGDPTGTGKGGTSIWGKKFPDEFKDELKVSLTSICDKSLTQFSTSVIYF